MAAALDPRNDFAAMADGLEQVSLRRPGSPAAVQACLALRRGVTGREAQASHGRYTAGDTAWHLPAAGLDGPPQPGDLIVDAAGVRWTVLEVAQSAVTGRFCATARDLAVAHGLDAFVDIDQAEYTKGAGGAVTAVWRPWRTGVRARIQPVEAAVDHARERQLTRTAYKIYVADEVLVDHRHRVRGPDGAIYRVAGLRKAERIDALLEIDAVRET